MELILFVGLQASGKTSFFVERFLNSHHRLSLDQLKTRHREQKFLETCLATKTPLVVDNTNPTRADRQRYIAAARGAGYAVHLYFFRSRVSDCLARNEVRSGKSRVPRPAVLGTSARLEIPAREEGYDVMKFVSIGDDNGFVVEDWRDEV